MQHSFCSFKSSRDFTNFSRWGRSCYSLSCPPPSCFVSCFVQITGSCTRIFAKWRIFRCLYWKAYRSMACAVFSWCSGSRRNRIRPICEASSIRWALRLCSEHTMVSRFEVLLVQLQRLNFKALECQPRGWLCADYAFRPSAICD